MSEHETYDAPEAAETDQPETLEPEPLGPAGRQAMQGYGPYDVPADQAEGTQDTADGVPLADETDSPGQGGWQASDTDERLGALQNLENTLAADQGRPAAEVIAEPMGGNLCGYYDGNAIHVNQDILESGDPVEAVDTVAHEGRHAYQHYAVENPGFHPNEAEVAAWRDNFDNYLDAETYGQERYESQPVEADARAYAASVVDALYG